jgi:hypothetical protein
MKRSPRLLLLGSLAVALAAHATTYVRVEKDGSKTYSDRPLPGGQAVDLQPAQTYSSPATPSVNQSVPAEQQLLQQMDSFTYQSCRLAPDNDASFTNPESVPISIQTTPSLRGEDVVSMTVDGKPVSAAAGTFVLAPAYRGSHSVQVTVRDRFGRELCSASTTFHVLRPSVNMPGRR